MNNFMAELLGYLVSEYMLVSYSTINNVNTVMRHIETPERKYPYILKYSLSETEVCFLL